MKDFTVRDLMKEALVRLLAEKNFSDISVTDLVKKAGISRASFYRWYSTIEQVLDDVLVDVRQILYTKVFTNLFSDKIEQKKEVIRTIFNTMKTKNFPFLNMLPENRHYITSKLEASIAANKDKKFSSKNEKYLPGILFAAVVLTAIYWAYYGYKESIEEMVEYVYSFIK